MKKLFFVALYFSMATAHALIDDVERGMTTLDKMKDIEETSCIIRTCEVSSIHEWDHAVLAFAYLPYIGSFYRVRNQIYAAVYDAIFRGCDQPIMVDLANEAGESNAEKCWAAASRVVDDLEYDEYSPNLQFIYWKDRTSGQDGNVSRFRNRDEFKPGVNGSVNGTILMDPFFFNEVEYVPQG